MVKFNAIMEIGLEMFLKQIQNIINWKEQKLVADFKGLMT